MSPAKSKTPTTDVTPEQALDALTRIVASDPFAAGARMHACRIAGARLRKAIDELHAAEAHAKALRDGMTTLITDALAAVNGTATLSKVKAPATTNGAAPDATTPTGGVQ